MNNSSIPVWEQYTLSIEEASRYFRIGENKLRRLVEEHKNANWLIMNGNRIQIKRKQFEKFIDEAAIQSFLAYHTHIPYNVFCASVSGNRI